MRRFLSLTFVCTLTLVASLARAQELDLAVSGSTLFAPKSYNASLAYPPPPLRGGLYVGASAQYVFKNHFGFNAEGMFRYHQGIYNGYQKFRPAFYDVNGVFAPRFTRKATGDFMAGVGIESLTFYNTFGTCVFANCVANVNSYHFLMHAGGGVRYTFWRNFFVRPEAHFYRVINNSQFNSGNVYRAGASIGYTFTSE